MNDKLMIGINGIEIKEVSEEFLNKLFNTSNSKNSFKYSPIGLFYVQKGFVIAVDNSTGDAWTEQFDTLKNAIAWLSGEIEIEDLNNKSRDYAVKEEVLHDGFIWNISQVITFLGEGKKIYRLHRYAPGNLKKEIVLDVSESDLGVSKPKMAKIKKPNMNISIYDLLKEVQS